MPCDTITTSEVQSELKGVNGKLLKRALESMGFTVNERDGVITFYGRHKETGMAHSGFYQNGKFTEQVVSGNSPLEVNAVKRAYSAQVVQTAAKAFGWKLTKTGANTYTAQKG